MNILEIRSKTIGATALIIWLNPFNNVINVPNNYKPNKKA